METKKSNDAAKWGSANWIRMYPWSRMDRKRRARAERAVGEETVKDLKAGPFARCLTARLGQVMDRYGVPISKPAQRKLEKMLLDLSAIERAIYDAAFGSALAKKWGV